MKNSLDRRSFLLLSAAGGAALATAAAVDAAAGAAEAVPQFAHGVASGDPLPDGVLLWTRVTPSADAVPGSGTGPVVSVTWEVAADPAFGTVVRSGVVSTGPDRDHTVKVDVRGLAPATSYWYRFGLGDVRSAVGRTRTAPALDAAVAGLRFAVVSCSNWQGGFFSAYRHLAARGDLDAVIHLGDYLYEYGVGEFGARGVTVRPHDPAHEMIMLADYRRRHAQYKTDPDLQALHATVPWVVTWDDHERANDAWSGGAENHQPATEGDWAARSAAARQAYVEWMPIRLGTQGQVYRRVRFGTLAELSMLDLRTYRSRQTSDPAQIANPARTIAGAEQLAWLKDGLSSSAARWKLVGNPVMIAPVGLDVLPDDLLAPVAELLGIPTDGIAVNPDQWDGYTADRRALLRHIADRQIRDTVFLTGDIHSSWASDLPLDAATYPVLSRSLATEFVTTSVTSDNIDDILNVPPRTVSVAAETLLRAANRHLKYVELDSHGYAVLDVRPARVQMDWWYLADRTDPVSATRYAKSFQVATGTQRVVPAAGPV